MSPIRTACLCLLVLVAAGCGVQPSEEPTVSQTSAAALPAGLVLAAAPGNAVAVSAAKADAKAGDVITVRGRVGGRVDPVVSGRAMFVLADPDGIAACDTREDDACGTPWDFCCEPKEKITANTLSVQVVDDAGRALSADLGGVGLRPGSFVVVQGIVADRPSADALVVNATGIFVE